MNKRVIWIINHYASHLETRHLELAKGFSEKGYDTAIITSSFHHGTHKYIYEEQLHIEERCKNVYFVYLHSRPSYDSNGGKRILNMFDFCNLVKNNAGQIAKHTGEPRFIIGSSAHPFVWESAYRLSKKYNAKFIAEFRDIWPLSLIEIQHVSKNHPFVRLLSLVEKRAYKRADAIVGTMPYAYLHVSNEMGFPREKVFWIPNGINTNDVEKSLIANNSIPMELVNYLDNNWCCVYVGSIVKSECIDYMLNSWKLMNNDNLHFAIIGDGAEKERIKDKIDKEKIQNVKMFPAVKPNEVPKILSKAKCCIAALEFGELGKYGLSKYKLNDYLFSGKPTIFACNYPNVVKDAGHFAIPIGDEKCLADTIEYVSHLTPEKIAHLRDSGMSHIKQNYDYSMLSEKYLSILERL